MLNIGEVVGKLDLSYAAIRSVNWQKYFQNLYLRPRNLLIGNIFSRYIHNQIYAPKNHVKMFITSLFIIPPQMETTQISADRKVNN